MGERDEDRGMMDDHSEDRGFDDPKLRGAPVGPAEYDAAFEQAMPMIEREDIPKPLRAFTDGELLRELRRRKRIAHIDVHSLTPEHYIKDGMPIEYRLKRLFASLAEPLVCRALNGMSEMGVRASKERGVCRFDEMRRLDFDLYFVVGKP